MSNNWKEDLGNYFSEHNIYRLDYLNKQLFEYCKEWTQYLSEFHKLHTHITEETPNIVIKVKNANRYLHFFIAYLSFRQSESKNNYFLFIKYTVGLAPPRKTISLKENDENNYEWTEEEFTEAGFIEKGYILQLLNNRFKEFERNIS